MTPAPKFDKPQDWVYANGNFACECLQCKKVIKDDEPRYIPSGFREGRLCVYCYITCVEKKEID